ncbi:MAG: DNA-binding protein [Variovorax sp.]
MLDSSPAAVRHPISGVELRTKSSRGVQLEEVLSAADALVQAGMKPTIERVRQQIGRGSPNTVSPMLDVWFSTLGQRISGTPASFDDEARKVPLEVTQIAQRLWDVAAREAQHAQVQQTAAMRRDLELQREALEARELSLIQREEAFEQNRHRLDAALASAQQEREVLIRQLAEQVKQTRTQADELSRQRTASAAELVRLNASVSELQLSRDALRTQHAHAMAEQQRLAQDSENRRVERHAAAERRLLAEVDRAREEAKRALMTVSKERDGRTQSEHNAAQTIRQLVQELAAVRTEVEKVKSDADARLQETQERYQRELTAHDQTRGLLRHTTSTSQAVSSKRRGSKTVPTQ